MASIFESALRLYSRLAPSERGAYRLVRFARRFRPRNNWASSFTTPQGLTLDLDLATYPDCCMAFGLYELTTARLINRLLLPGDFFVDAGANIGYFTLLAAQRVGPTGRVHAFEPTPANHARLLAHIRKNHLEDRITVYPIALSDHPGHITIHTYEGDPRYNHGCASIVQRPWDHDHAHTVPTARLDATLPPGTTPRLIKMDIEGAEPLAIAGMAALLASARPPMIIAEYNPALINPDDPARPSWVRLALQIQPAYQVFLVASYLKPIDPTPQPLARLEQVNLLLRTTTMNNK